MSTPILKMLAPVVTTLALLAIPTPEGLTDQAWQYFALFIGVVVALVLEPVPAPLSGLVGVVLATVFRLVPPKAGAEVTTGSALQWGLSGFNDSTVWLIFVAFMADAAATFVPVQRRLAEKDALNKWITHIGSAVFAVPPGAAEGEYVGQHLIEG